MSGNTLPFGVEFTKLKKIAHPNGNIFHALKASEHHFNFFGEAYFTTINNQRTKGWKLHKEMVMNLIVISGEVDFHFYDAETLKTYTARLGQSNYGRLTVPAGIWMAFSGKGNGMNLILNIASLEHDPDEAVNAPLEKFPIG